jgi:hypothetical protein
MNFAMAGNFASNDNGVAPTITMTTKQNPGAEFRPGANREFQFPE